MSQIYSQKPDQCIRKESLFLNRQDKLLFITFRNSNSFHKHLSFCPQGCARFPEFVQNFSECQILWSLCSVDFHTFTLQLPVQALHSVMPEFQVFVSSLDNCQIFSKTSTPHGRGVNQLRQTPPPGYTPRYGHCSVRYASYWNAFLFLVITLENIFLVHCNVKR